jgi:hypothetical protein
MSSSHRFTAGSGQREKNKNNSCNNIIKKRKKEKGIYYIHRLTPPLYYYIWTVLDDVINGHHTWDITVDGIEIDHASPPFPFNKRAQNGAIKLEIYQNHPRKKKK